jgi:hypothetical protein
MFSPWAPCLRGPYRELGFSDLGFGIWDLGFSDVRVPHIGVHRWHMSLVDIGGTPQLRTNFRPGSGTLSAQQSPPKDV